MPEAIGGLRGVLAYEVGRSVAAIAGRHRAVRRLAPAVELFAHDVAVGAGRRIVRKVGPPLGIREGIDTNPYGNTDHHPEQDALNRAQLHLGFRFPTMALASSMPAAPLPLQIPFAGLSQVGAPPAATSPENRP